MDKLEFYTYSTTESLARVASYLIARGSAFSFNGKEIKFTCGTYSFQDMLDTDHTIKDENFEKVFYDSYKL